MAEMRRIAEAVAECNVGDRSTLQNRVGEIEPALFETLQPNVISESRAVSRKDAVKVPDRDAHRCRDFGGSQHGLGEMGVDKLQDAPAEIRGTVEQSLLAGDARHQSSSRSTSQPSR